MLWRKLPAVISKTHSAPVVARPPRRARAPRARRGGRGAPTASGRRSRARRRAPPPPREQRRSRARRARPTRRRARARGAPAGATGGSGRCASAPRARRSRRAAGVTALTATSGGSRAFERQPQALRTHVGTRRDERRDLREGVHAGVGAPGDAEPHGLAQDGRERALEHSLDRAQAGLPRPALERACPRRRGRGGYAWLVAHPRPLQITEATTITAAARTRRTASAGRARSGCRRVRATPGA